MLQLPDNRSQRQVIRLLIVDDVAESAQNVQSLLRYESDIQVVAVASSGREAIARAQAMRPDVVLIDLSLRDMDGAQVVEQIVRETQAIIVVMSAQSGREYSERAMALGARGYLVKPFSSEELVRTLRTAFAIVIAQGGFDPLGRSGPNTPNAANGRLRKIVTVYSPKGGVGRSVLAANLAIALQKSAQKSSRRAVALVDANLQSGDQHVLLNITSRTTIEDLRDVGPLDQDTINSVFVPHAGSGIRVLRAPASPESAEFFTADAMKTILLQLRDYFDYVVIDADTRFSEEALIALEIADLIVAITTLEVTTINRIGQFFEVAEQLGYPRSKIRLVCNRVDGYYEIRPAQVEARLRTRFVAQIPEDNKLVVASVNRGVPFVLAQRGAPISASVFALARRLEEILNNPPENPGPHGGKPRVFGLF